MITIKTFVNLHEAEFAKSRLEAFGIDAFLAGEHSFSLAGAAGYAIGIGLEVDELNAPRALALLNDSEGAPDLALLDDFVPPPAEE